MTMQYAGRLIRQRERLYLARTGQRGRLIRGVEAMHAADGIAAWRWWTLDELDATAETVWRCPCRMCTTCSVRASHTRTV